jgi:hypothetical protein
VGGGTRYLALLLCGHRLLETTRLWDLLLLWLMLLPLLHHVLLQRLTRLCILLLLLLGGVLPLRHHQPPVTGGCYCSAAPGQALVSGYIGSQMVQGTSFCLLCQHHTGPRG